MSFWLTREERTAYEKKRRDRIIQESRDYRVIQGWLMVQYPDILAAFVAFRENLQRQNPCRKDLTTSPMFRRFVREKTGTYYVLLSWVLCDCKPIVFCFFRFRFCTKEDPGGRSDRPPKRTCSRSEEFG